jgi:hypothetical protein
MNLPLRPLRFAIGQGIAVTISAAGMGVLDASAQSKFEIRYAVSMTGIPIGEGAWTIAIGTEHYTVSADGVASGLMSLLVKGKGTATTQGSVKDGRLISKSFAIKGIEDDQDTDLRMALNNGNVTELLFGAASDSSDRIPITAAHLRGVLDPLTALLIRDPGSRNMVEEAEGCNRMLPIFDGQRRYDVALWFKRVEAVKADVGFQGPALVCGMMLQPIAGHRASSTIIKYVAGKRDIETWFAPVASKN